MKGKFNGIFLLNFIETFLLEEFDFKSCLASDQLTIFILGLVHDLKKLLDFFIFLLFLKSEK